jgi:two-component system cell cycle sensor histidine kinase/response regulator CckA
VKRVSAETMLALIEEAPDCFVLLAEDGTFRYVNAPAECLLGRPRGKLIGKSAWEVFPEAITTAFFSEYERARGEGTTVRFEDYLPGLDRWLEVSATPGSAGIAVWFRDVTDARRREERVRESEERYRLIVETSAEGIWMLDANDHTTFVNSALAQMLGYAPEEMVGRTPFEFMDEPAQLEAAGHLERLRQGLADRFDFRFQRQDGSPVQTSIGATPTFDADGRYSGALAMVIDVTELRTLEAQLRQSQKMEAVGALAGGIAHDFNNLLTAITGYGEIAAEKTAAGGTAEDDVAEILGAADRAADLVHQLLAFSRRQVLEPKVVDLSAVACALETILRRTIGEHIELEMALVRELEHVKADPGQLQQVLLNLIVNARDAMPHGGRVVVRTHSAEVTVSAAEHRMIPGRYTVLSVSDNGNGMDEETRARIFEPFFTTKAPGDGTGLGLSTAYGIVKQSGGYIWADSVPGSGTTMSVYLPVTAEPLAEPAPEPTADAAPATGTVLLVEDEAVVRDLVQAILERDGYHVIAAPTPAEALEVSSSSSRSIDLLLTDVVMPGMNGPAVARTLSESREGLKVLYMSGYSDEGDVERGLLRPGTAFIQKPFRAQELTEKIRSLLAR